MSVDKKPERLAQDTLALIADKLAVVRPEKPEPVADSPELEIPRLPSVAQLETPPVLSDPAEFKAALEEDDTLAPLPPPIPPAPPAPKIDPFVAADPVHPPKPVAASLAGASIMAVPPVTSPPAVVSAPPAKGGRGSLVASFLAIIIALAALGLSIYQGMLFRQSIDGLQRNAARGEYARACRQIIDAYFQIKPKVGALMPTPDRGNIAGASRISETNRLEAQAAVARFGGLGTYFANFQDAGTRARYTELTKLLTSIYDNARNTPLADIERVFAPADRLFNQMTDDCGRLSRAMGL